MIIYDSWGYGNFISSYCLNTHCQSYLELGVQVGMVLTDISYNAKVPRCMGVDIVDVRQFGKEIPFKKCSTDDFFKSNQEFYEVIFIDADHSFEQVKKDFESSLLYLIKGGTIFIHDTDPASAEYVDPGLCGDSYKIIDYIHLNHPELDSVTMPFNTAGLCMVRRRADNRFKL